MIADVADFELRVPEELVFDREVVLDCFGNVGIVLNTDAWVAAKNSREGRSRVIEGTLAD